MTTRDRLGQPPGICDLCYTNQTFHAADQGRDVYYCDHNGVLAILGTDFGD